MRDAVRQAYDEIAEEYAGASDDVAEAAPLLDPFSKRLEAGSRILDVGCGDGSPVSAHLGNRFDVVGIDISREQLRLATERVPETALLQGEMTALPIETASVEAVLAFYSIIHVPRSEHQSVFEEWARVLEPGGWVLFSSGEEAWDGRNLDWLDTGVEMVWSYPGPEETRAGLEKAGFRVESDQPVPDSLADAGAKRFFLAQFDPEPINEPPRK